MEDRVRHERVVACCVCGCADGYVSIRVRVRDLVHVSVHPFYLAREARTVLDTHYGYHSIKTLCTHKSHYMVSVPIYLICAFDTSIGKSGSRLRTSGRMRQ